MTLVLKNVILTLGVGHASVVHNWWTENMLDVARIQDVTLMSKNIISTLGVGRALVVHNWWTEQMSWDLRCYTQVQKCYYKFRRRSCLCRSQLVNWKHVVVMTRASLNCWLYDVFVLYNGSFVEYEMEPKICGERSGAGNSRRIRSVLLLWWPELVFIADYMMFLYL